MTDYKIIIAVVALAALAGFTQYAKAQLYDDGIPILTAKNAQSGEYMQGYMDGVVKGSQDVDAFNADKIKGVDGNHPPSCPLIGSEFGDYCSGYSDIVVDKLD